MVSEPEFSGSLFVFNQRVSYGRFLQVQGVGQPLAEEIRLVEANRDPYHDQSEG